MEDSQLVSIIIATYNRADYLPISIGSVLSQTFQNWELIIWNDGSTDTTEKVINSFDDNRIQYFSDSNHGQSYALNQALRVSKGEYIAFLDDDDIWMSEKLSTQVQVMNAHPRIEVLFSDFINNNSLTVYNSTAFQQYSYAMKLLEPERIEDSIYIIKNGMLECLTSENFILPSTVITRRGVIEKAGYFSEELRNTQDFELWWRMSVAGICFAFMDEVYVTRHKLPGSLSSSSILTCENTIKGLNLCLNYTLSKGRKDLLPYLNRLYRNAWQNMIPLYGNDGDKKKILRAFFQSMKYGFSLGSIRLLFEAIITCK